MEEGLAFFSKDKQCVPSLDESKLEQLDKKDENVKGEENIVKVENDEPLVLEEGEAVVMEQEVRYSYQTRLKSKVFSLERVLTLTLFPSSLKIGLSVWFKVVRYW